MIVYGVLGLWLLCLHGRELSSQHSGPTTATRGKKLLHGSNGTESHSGIWGRSLNLCYLKDKARLYRLPLSSAVAVVKIIVFETSHERHHFVHARDPPLPHVPE